MPREASEYGGADGYLKFVISRQPEEMRPLLQEAVRLVRQETGWTNGYAIVQAWAMEIVSTYGHRSPSPAARGEAGVREPQRAWPICPTCGDEYDGLVCGHCQYVAGRD